MTTENPGEVLYRHKDHFHTERTATNPTIKVLGPGTVNPDTGELEYGHKDHAHGVSGNKIPGSTNPDTSEGEVQGSHEPTEEDVMRASLAAQRRALRKGQLRGRMSTVMASSYKPQNQLG